MLTGKRFRIATETLAVTQSSVGRRTTVTIPAGEIVKVVSGPSGEGLVDVLWNGQIFDMFEIDLQLRGEELPDVSEAHT